ncbi:hypothetical protein QAD02_005306, partial [Eretmocerus hayati]
MITYHYSLHHSPHSIAAIDKGWGLDRKTSVILSTVALQNFDQYKCIMDSNDSHEVKVYIKLPERITITLSNNQQFLISGDILEMKCVFHTVAGFGGIFRWSTPRHGFLSPTILTQDNEYENTRVDRQMLSSVLTVYNVTSEDQGEYTCKMVFYERRTVEYYTDPVFLASAYIYVNDSRTKYIDLRTDDNYVIAKMTTVAQLSAFIRGYPKPMVFWSDIYGNAIRGNTSFEVGYNSSTTALLRITYIPDFKIMGNYSLTAFNGEEEKILYIWVTVEGISVNLEIPTESTILNEEANFTCQVQAYPQTNISITYIKCESFNSGTNCTSVDME